MILDKKLLTKQGYLNFNLKDLNENLFNEFKEHLTQKYLRTKINVLRADSIILEKNLSKIKEIDDKFNVRTEGRDFETEDSSYRKLQNKYHGNLDNLKEVNKYLASMDVTKTCGVGGGGQVWLYGPYRNMIPSKNNLIESLYLQTVVELYKDDIINHDEKLVIDLKTTNDISKFKWSAYKYNYDSQAYIYKKIFGYDLLFLVIDKNTQQIGIFDCSDKFYESGSDKVTRAIEVYELFYKTENFDPNQYFLTKTL